MTETAIIEKAVPLGVHLQWIGEDTALLAVAVPVPVYSASVVITVWRADGQDDDRTLQLGYMLPSVPVRFEVPVEQLRDRTLQVSIAGVGADGAAVEMTGVITRVGEYLDAMKDARLVETAHREFVVDDPGDDAVRIARAIEVAGQRLGGELRHHLGRLTVAVRGSDPSGPRPNRWVRALRELVS